MDAGQVVAAGHLVSGRLVSLPMSALSVSEAPFWFWWLVPVLSTVVVVAGVRWSRRDRRPTDSDRSVEEYARFRAALGPERHPETTDPAETRSRAR
ncbi:MAG TPA: hypothetical protein VFL94_04505 [Actinomycetales bacterium]|nr:hypothetical protein [Actinomycetales bacterium]